MAGRSGREWLLLVPVAATVIVALSGAVGALWSWSIETARSGRPPLIRDLAEAYRTDKVLSDAFNKRVQSAFPVGMPGAEVHAALVRQGFSGLCAEGCTLSFVIREGLVCSSRWIVSWQTDGSGAVTRIWGLAMLVCL
jgi:hypothetical protein